MLRRLRTLLTGILFGPSMRGWRNWAGDRQGPCAYCRQERQLVEVPGPIGTGNIFVCRTCADSCIAIVRWVPTAQETEGQQHTSDLATRHPPTALVAPRQKGLY